MPERSRQPHRNLLNCWYFHDRVAGHHTLYLYIDESLHQYQGITSLTSIIQDYAQRYNCSFYAENCSPDLTSIIVTHHEIKPIVNFRRVCRLLGVYFKKEHI